MKTKKNYVKCNFFVQTLLNPFTYIYFSSTWPGGTHKWQNIQRERDSPPPSATDTNGPRRWYRTPVRTGHGQQNPGPTHGIQSYSMDSYFPPTLPTIWNNSSRGPVLCRRHNCCTHTHTPGEVRCWVVAGDSLQGQVPGADFGLDRDYCRKGWDRFVAKRCH